MRTRSCHGRVSGCCTTRSGRSVEGGKGAEVTTPDRSGSRPRSGDSNRLVSTLAGADVAGVGEVNDAVGEMESSAAPAPTPLADIRAGLV